MGTHPIFESDFDCLTEMYALRCLAVIGCVQGWVARGEQFMIGSGFKCRYEGQIYDEGLYKDHTRCQTINCHCEQNGRRKGMCELSFAQLGSSCQYYLPEGCIEVEDKYNCGMNPTFVMERNRRISCKPYSMSCNGK